MQKLLTKKDVLELLSKDRKTVEIPSEFTEISPDAICNCKSIEKLVIPRTIRFARKGLFEACPNLKFLYVDSETIDDDFCDIEGEFPHYKRLNIGLKELVIGDNVKNIGSQAFWFTEELEKVTIGNNVRTIGDRAFDSCCLLKSITIPDSVTVMGDAAFYGCTGLESVVIGNGLRNIGIKSFGQCHGLKKATLGTAIEAVEESAFSYCKKLAKVQFNGKFPQIEKDSFKGCVLLDKEFLEKYGIDEDACGPDDAF